MSTPTGNSDSGQTDPHQPQYGYNTPPNQGQHPFGQQNSAQSPYGYQAAQPAGYSYPGGMNPAQSMDKGPAPKNVEIAFWLIIAAGVLSFISSIVSSGEGQLSGLASGFGVLTIVTAAVGAGIYVLLAFFIRKGQNWARITATVLAALSLVSYVFSLVALAALQANEAFQEQLQGQDLSPGPLSTALGVLVTLLGVAGVIMTYLPGARPYFAKPPTAGRY